MAARVEDPAGWRQASCDATGRADSSGAGIPVIEFPVDPDSPSYRFMGFVRFFEAAGFREVGRAGSRRHVINWISRERVSAAGQSATTTCDLDGPMQATSR